jgi:hypothetical protein
MLTFSANGLNDSGDRLDAAVGDVHNGAPSFRSPAMSGRRGKVVLVIGELVEWKWPFLESVGMFVFRKNGLTDRRCGFYAGLRDVQNSAPRFCGPAMCGRRGEVFLVVEQLVAGRGGFLERVHVGRHSYAQQDTITLCKAEREVETLQR